MIRTYIELRVPDSIKDKIAFVDSPFPPLEGDYVTAITIKECKRIDGIVNKVLEGDYGPVKTGT